MTAQAEHPVEDGVQFVKQTIITRKGTECEFTAMMAATSTALPLQRQLRYIFIIMRQRINKQEEVKV